MKAVSPRPLYNQPGMLKNEKVVLVEGEKCAEALIKEGICATTAMNGASAPTDKTDWSPLKGKEVIIWPDNDEVGLAYAKAAAKAITNVGAISVEILIPPIDKPSKWDAADAVMEGFDIKAFIANPSKKLSSIPSLTITNWSINRYKGKAKEQRFLVDGMFPMGCVSILAAMGDTGKGMLLLDLALKVASSRDQDSALGPRITEDGDVVIFSAEDDYDELHRRIERLDTNGLRYNYQNNLFIIPLPNAQGPFPIVKNVYGKGPEISSEFEKIRVQLSEIENIKLIVFDPLASFIQADINADPAIGVYATGILANLATETGAAVIVTHHMRKPANGKPITTAEQARDAIRGTSALVDGVRCAYALWPASEEHQEFVFNTLRVNRSRGLVYQGAVVKTNGPANKEIRTYFRSDIGLLEDISDRLKQNGYPDYSLTDSLVKSIAYAAQEGHPFTHTGGPGIYKQRHRLASTFHNLSRHRIEQLVQNLLNEGVIVKGMAVGSKEDKWLDVPGGNFALGIGEFQLGAEGRKCLDII
jgi:hypothetical protein